MKFKFLLTILIALSPAIAMGDGTDTMGNYTAGTNAGLSLETDAAGARATGNTYIGVSAAPFDTTGNGNVGIGFNVFTSKRSGDGNIGIGYMAGSALTTSSHKLYITNAWYSTNGIFGDLATGYIGINTASPTAALDVTGDVVISGALTSLARPTAITSDSVMTLALFPSGSTISVTSTAEVTLPTAVPGIRYTFITVGTDSVIIIASASDNIDVPGDVNETEVVAAGAVDEVITLEAVDATSWKVISYVGTWAALGD